MKNKNTTEDELNVIRIDLYEQTKDMTPSERVAYLRSLSTPVLEEFGLHTKDEIKKKERMSM